MTQLQVLKAPKKLAGEYSEITSFTIPSKVTNYFGKSHILFGITGKLNSDPIEDPEHPFMNGTPNWCVGFAYVGGPMPSIPILVNGQYFDLEPGMAIVTIHRNPTPPEEIAQDIEILGLEPGVYSFAAITGYVAEGNLIIPDDWVDASLEVSYAWWLYPAIAVAIAIPAGLGFYYVRKKGE